MKKSKFYQFEDELVPNKVRAAINSLLLVKQREAASLRSRTKGSLGELMSTMLFEKVQRNDVVIDKCIFETPFGKRRIDNFLASTKQAVESKNTYVVARKSIINQIRKDSYCIQQGLISELIWVCYEGASAKVIALLAKENILYLGLRDEIMNAIQHPDNNQHQFEQIIEC